VMHEDVVQNQPAYVQSTITSIAQAQRYLRENRQSAAELLSKDGQNYLPQPKAAIDRAMNFYDPAEYAASGAIQHADWNNTRADFQPFPYATYTQQLVSWMKETTVDGDAGFVASLDGERVHRELIVDQFAREAIGQSGGAAAFGIAASLSRSEQIGV
jgi:NitT/TauT family transport system substrate-binding protein